jgi:hypothetical protein
MLVDRLLTGPMIWDNYTGWIVLAELHGFSRYFV